MAAEPLRVGCIGMGWWSDVLADAIKRSGKLEIVACYTRSPAKRHAFAAKYDCIAAESYDATTSTGFAKPSSPARSAKVTTRQRSQ